MAFAKKSLGQNFLIDKNIIKKIVSLSEIINRNIIEIGPGKGALTDEILKRKPNSLIIIEKDYEFTEKLKIKYINNKSVKVFNADILKFDIEKIVKKNSIIFGNLPYNISSQILIKFLKFKKWPPKYTNLIFMFQRELGERIIAKHKTKNYGRLSILSNFRLDTIKKFFVSPNCFSPIPKVNSMVINFKPKNKYKFYFQNIDNLEKITNIFFSNKRKMINKNIKKLLSDNKIATISNLNINYRPADIKPETYYKITELYEQK